jgi:hypothetical protein
MTPKMPVPTTIREMFRRLTVVMEATSPEDKLAFKRAWLEGAERMNAETERMRRERLNRAAR